MVLNLVGSMSANVPRLSFIAALRPYVLRDEKENCLANKTVKQKTEKAEKEVVSSGRRVIGIRHRVKQTAKGEARPTQLVIRDGHNTKIVALVDDDAELDFVLGRLPAEWRKLTPEDAPETLPQHHVKWRKLKSNEQPDEFPKLHVRETSMGKFEVATDIVSEHGGAMSGDIFAMCLGGSGDRLAFALANRGQKIGATVQRIPPFVLKEKRGEGKQDNDAQLLTDLFIASPELFQEVRPRDQKLIAVRENYRDWLEASKARIACGQRLHQRHIGSIFLNEAGQYPEGAIEDSFDHAKANNAIYLALQKEEETALKVLNSSCEDLDVYQLVFKPIVGMGPRISARLISTIMDIRRFKTKAQFKAFLGVHVLKDGRFARRRAGVIANWNTDARQALFLLADQFNRRPDSYWGKKLLEYKKKFRVTHPEVVKDEETGKTKYSDGHILRMAHWRTVTKFAEYLWRQWWELEGRKGGIPTGTPPENPGDHSTEVVFTDDLSETLDREDIVTKRTAA